jgi:hypothetical protein
MGKENKWSGGDGLMESPGGGCKGGVCRRPPKTPSNTVKATKTAKAKATKAKATKAKATKAKATKDASGEEEWLPKKPCDRQTCRETDNYTWRKDHCGLKKNKCDKGSDTVWQNGDCHEKDEKATVENDADDADDSQATKATRGRITSNASCSGKGTCFDQFMLEDEDLQTYMANDADNMVIFVEEADRRAAYCTSVKQIESLGVMKKQNKFYECETRTRRGKVSHGRSRVNPNPLARIPLTYSRYVDRESLGKLLKREVRYITLRRIGHTDRLMSADVFDAKVGAGISGMHCQLTSEDIWEAVEADRSC